ncbi:unnamed protein product [Boreogadus saida]
MPTSGNGSGRHFSEPRCSIEEHDPSLLSNQNNIYQERSVDPPENLPGDNRRKDSTLPHRAHLKYSDGQADETVSFITVANEPGGGACSCGRCRSLMCRVLTCGLYRVCQRTLCAPCLTAPLTQPENKERTKEEEEEEEEEAEEYRDEPAWLEDVHLDGVKVDIVREAPSSSNVRPASPKPPQPPDKTSRRSYDSIDWEEEEEEEEEVAYGDEGVDALITKKLLALYTEYQIEELARCTTDSLFLRKSTEIHQLISSLAVEHQMDEQEAEGRLVRGIIRISTRRSKKGRRPHDAVSERTLSDSGNETMRNSDSCSNNNDYKSSPNFQISDVTHSDMYARNMRRNNSDGRSVPYSDTMSSSGVSVAPTAVRT